MCPPCCWTTHSSRRRHWPTARSMKRCDSFLHSVTIACFSCRGWLSWIVDVDNPSAEGHLKQRNRLDSSPGCLGARCQARWTWRFHAAGRPYVSVFLAVCEWGILASSSSSREPKSTANITADMFSVAVYYQTSVKDASQRFTRGRCSRTAHSHTLQGTH